MIARLRRGRLRGTYAPNGREFGPAGAPKPRYALLGIARQNRPHEFAGWLCAVGKN